MVTVGCGYPPPREVRPGLYELQFCEDEQKCFDAMKKTCPNGYRITKFGPLRPQEFSCT